jgi:hypothetical protein
MIYNIVIHKPLIHGRILLIRLIPKLPHDFWIERVVLFNDAKVSANAESVLASVYRLGIL